MQQVSEATHHLLRRLFDLSAKTSWFFQSDRDAEMVKVLQELVAKGNPVRSRRWSTTSFSITRKSEPQLAERSTRSLIGYRLNVFGI